MENLNKLSGFHVKLFPGPNLLLSSSIIAGLVRLLGCFLQQHENCLYFGQRIFRIEQVKKRRILTLHVSKISLSIKVQELLLHNQTHIV